MAYYKTIEQCIADGTHLTDCDTDGYCNVCGEQDSGENNSLPDYIKEFLTDKHIACNRDDGRTITITDVWGFFKKNYTIGNFSDIALCMTSEGNEVGISRDGEVIDDSNKVIATIESNFGNRD